MTNEDNKCILGVAIGFSRETVPHRRHKLTHLVHDLIQRVGEAGGEFFARTEGRSTSACVTVVDTLALYF